MKIIAALVCSILIFHFCNSQTVRNYNCVVASRCNDMVIDPRVGETEYQNNIITPGGSDCPSGTVRCNSVVCGNPLVAVRTGSGNSQVGSLPWQAYLRANGQKYVGGGVLIDQYNVLTAAHKISNLTGYSLSVLMGVYNPNTIPNPPVQESKVLRAYININYNKDTLKDDVAILRLQTPITFTNNVLPMCLPTGLNIASFINNPAANCFVAGWGQTSYTIVDAPFNPLKQADVPIVSYTTCRASFVNILGEANTNRYLDTDNREICAGGVANIDACTQDGGSPLTCKNPTTQSSYVVVGLVLWGKGCGVAGRYGVYLNVISYLSWINRAVQCSLQYSACSNTAKIQDFAGA